MREHTRAQLVWVGSKRVEFTSFADDRRNQLQGSWLQRGTVLLLLNGNI